MSATNEKYLNKNAGIIEIVKLPEAFTPLLADLSNVEAVKTAVDALTLVRISSIVDLLVEEDYSEQIKIETDDNGVIYTSANPGVKIGWKYYEISDPAVLTEMVNKIKVAVVGWEYVGNTLENTEIPALIVRLTSTDPVTAKIKQTYCIDATFGGVLVSGFLDVKRAGDLPNSNFEFNGNTGGWIFTFTDNVVA